MRGGGDEEFVRRIGAVLVAEVEPGALPSGAVDAPGAVSDALEVLRGAGGDAEPLGADGVVAIFDDPAVALRASIQLHLRAPGRDGGAWRAGIHVADVVMTGEGTIGLAAIDHAATLTRLARPGTTAVRAHALPALGHLRGAVVEPLEISELPGIPADGVLLIIPRWSPFVLSRRRVVALLAGTALLGGAGAAIWVVGKQRAGGGEREHVTLAVGPFRSSVPDPARAWIGPALRDGLDTQLSGLSEVKVFSQEFIDFVMTRKSLTAIEVANSLGIEKMVSGSVLVVGDTIRVEARIVDVGSGILEGGYVATGREHDFLAIESDLVSGVIAQLHLQLSAEEERRLAALRASDVNALRRLLDAGQGSQPTLPSQKNPAGIPDGQSWLREHLGVRAAHADDAAAEVAVFLDEYRRATERRDVTALAMMYVTFSADQRAALERYFGGVRDLHVDIERVEVAVIGEEAVVSYTRTDDFVDVQTGRPQHASIRLTKTLRRVEGRWRFAST